MRDGEGKTAKGELSIELPLGQLQGSPAGNSGSQDVLQSYSTQGGEGRGFPGYLYTPLTAVIPSISSQFCTRADWTREPEKVLRHKDADAGRQK